MENLRAIAERDLEFILEDVEAGWGNPIVVTNPDGLTGVVNGQTGEVHALVDPETGATISVKTAHCSMRQKTLFDLGFTLPKAQPDETKKPWVFQFADQNGIVRQYAVSEARPDNTLGVITIMLEFFKDVA